MSSPARWKSILLTLPDNAFFDIVRNYLGEVKTPFNKHDLIARLERFLLNSDTQRRIVSLIDEDDTQMLTAIDVLREPDYDTLFSFLQTEHSFVDLHHHLLNLEDRLLVYRDPDEKTICLNPLLQPLLRATVLRTEVLFPADVREPPEGPAGHDPIPWFTDAVVPAVLSFVLRASELFRSDGSFRKKVEDDIRAAFASLAQGSDSSVERFRLVFDALKGLGALGTDQGRYVILAAGVAALGSLDRAERYELYWAAALDTTAPRSSTADADRSSRAPGIDESAPDLRDTQSRPGPEGFARALRRYLQILRPDRAYPRASAERLFAAIFLRESGIDVVPEAGIARAPQIVDVLLALDLLVVTPQGSLARNAEIDAALVDAAGDGEAEAILQPTFALTLKPFVGLVDGVTTALLADIRKYDRYPEYELNQSAFSRFVATGRGPGEALELLGRLTGKPIAQNIEFTLRHWAEEFHSVATYEGTVLVADEQRRHLIEHSETFSPFVRRILAPGVYLLDSRERTAWEDALRALGIGLLPGSQVVGDTSSISRPKRAAGNRERTKDVELFDIEEDLPSMLDAVREDPKSVEFELLQALDALSLAPDKHEELAQRIRRKLIIQPDQINPHVTRGERAEAKGLDYIGKVRLIEQVLKQRRGAGSVPGDYLEILQRTAKGDPSRSLVRPLELEKTGTQLILRGRAIPGDEEVRIPVSKMGLVRRLRGSLFG